MPREWPDIPLPTFKAQAEAVVASATRSKGQEEPAKQPQSDTVKELLEIHRSYVDVLLSMGVDPLKEYEEKKAENILAGVKSGDTKCKVCQKSCSTSQKAEEPHKEAPYRENSHIIVESVQAILWRQPESKSSSEEAPPRRC